MTPVGKNPAGKKTPQATNSLLDQTQKSGGMESLEDTQYEDDFESMSKSFMHVEGIGKGIGLKAGKDRTFTLPANTKLPVIQNKRASAGLGSS